MGGQTAIGTIPSLQRAIAYATNEQWKNLSHEMIDSIQLRRRGIITEKEYVMAFARHGASQEFAEDTWKGSETLLGAADLLVLKWRNIIDDKTYLTKMEALGFNEETAVLWEKRNQFYPSAADLINWQAKEVYEPDAVKKYGLDDELELLTKDAFYKTGINDEQIRNYWIAHWQHPALSMVFDMLHRTTYDKTVGTGELGGQVKGKPYYHLLNRDDVYEYYRLVEVPPYWRNKLTALSYTPYSRVDVRRMYAAGVLGREEVKKAYLDIGYANDKAEALTDFAVASTLPAERSLTRTMIEQAFDIGELTREEAINFLIELRYDEAEANLIIALKEYKIHEDVLDDIIATIKTSYTHGLLTYAEAIAKLDALNLKATYREKIVASITREKEKVYQMPSKADLVTWGKAEIIDIATFKDYMDKIGFQEKEIAIWVTQIEKVIAARVKYAADYQKSLSTGD